MAAPGVVVIVEDEIVVDDVELETVVVVVSVKLVDVVVVVNTRLKMGRTGPGKSVPP